MGYNTISAHIHTTTTGQHKEAPLILHSCFFSPCLQDLESGSGQAIKSWIGPGLRKMKSLGRELAWLLIIYSQLLVPYPTKTLSSNGPDTMLI